MATNALRPIFADIARDQAPRAASASRGGEEPAANVQALRAIAPERTRRRPLRVADASRLTFLSHFVICLAVAAVAFFAAVNNVPQTIWQDDMSRMTSVIGALFVGTMIYLGWQAWLADDPTPGDLRHQAPRGGEAAAAAAAADSSFGHLAERLSVMAGFVGTAIGLSLQAHALAGGSTSFTALATSLFTTACGGGAAALIAIMTFNLEAGIRRRRR